MNVTHFVAVQEEMNILLGVTGSVAAIKADQIVHHLKHQTADQNVNVKVIWTENAAKFNPDYRNVPNIEGSFTDEDEWGAWKGRGDPVLHIDLTKWADVFLVCPLDALTLSKLAQGHCDNLLTCALIAWPADKPLILCPAMNTNMWTNPLVRQNLHKAELLSHVSVIPPISKKLMCGDTGIGAMEEPEIVALKVREIVKHFKSPPDWKDKLQMIGSICGALSLAYFLIAKVK